MHHGYYGVVEETDEYIESQRAKMRPGIQYIPRKALWLPDKQNQPAAGDIPIPLKQLFKSAAEAEFTWTRYNEVYGRDRNLKLKVVRVDFELREARVETKVGVKVRPDRSSKVLHVWRGEVFSNIGAEGIPMESDWISICNSSRVVAEIDRISLRLQGRPQADERLCKVCFKGV